MVFPLNWGRPIGNWQSEMSWECGIRSKEVVVSGRGALPAEEPCASRGLLQAPESWCSPGSILHILIMPGTCANFAYSKLTLPFLFTYPIQKGHNSIDYTFFLITRHIWVTQVLWALIHTVSCFPLRDIPHTQCVYTLLAKHWDRPFLRVWGSTLLGSHEWTLSGFQ